MYSYLSIRFHHELFGISWKSTPLGYISLLHKGTLESQIWTERSVSTYKLKDVKSSNHSNTRTAQKSIEAVTNKEFDVREGHSYQGTKRQCVNNVNIQMLQSNLRCEIFGNTAEDRYIDKNLIKKAQAELKSHGLWRTVANYMPDVPLTLPQLYGKNIEEHFMIIGKEQSDPYKNLVLKFIKAGMPKPPKQWLLQKGWVKYQPGHKPESVPAPDDDALVLDVEVCVQLGDAPTLATAVSEKAWYGWVCPLLPEDISPVPISHYTKDMLIPMEANVPASRPRIVVSHNVAYDRARIKEQYDIKNSALRFLDTMSLHICIGGVTSCQKIMLKTKIAKNEENENWREYTSLNSLKEVYKLYCKKEMSKETRSLFVNGTFQDIRNDFQEAMKYCAMDTIASYEVLQKLFVIFLQRFPHPVTLAGMLELTTSFLPINHHWQRYLMESEQTFEDVENEIFFLLGRKSDNACQLMHEEKYKQDLWMWDEDWSTKEYKLLKSRRKDIVKTDVKIKDEDKNKDSECEDDLREKFQYLYEMQSFLPKVKPLLPGYPAWYRKLCSKPDSEDWMPGPHLISTSMRITPKLLKLKWDNYPLHHIIEYGWGILVADLNVEPKNTEVPFQKLKELTLQNQQSASKEKQENNLAAWTDNLEAECEEHISKNTYASKYKQKADYTGSAIFCDQLIEDCCHFLRLPHKDGESNNVGNPLARDFLSNFTDGKLTSSDSVAEKVLEMASTVSYWRNNRERIKGQMVVWLKEDQNKKIGAIVPQLVPCGTLTRRANERTWLTASNIREERIGSELRAMVQAPPGYHIVGADVDSQELWIASMIGDAYFAGMHGSTPIGWMTLNGNKADETDLHSVTAKAVGISRKQAKILNYARMYGAGWMFTQKLLQQFNPGMTEAEARSKARKMTEMTKGIKLYKIKKSAQSELSETVPELHSHSSAKKISNLLAKPMSEVFEKQIWYGGTESAMFNRLEEIAHSPSPVTPFLGGRMSRAIEPKYNNDESYTTTRVNWVVQSGAVDFLHLMLVCMRWLTKGQARFCLSFHDEVRYLVPSENRYHTALAMHITNLLTRSFCASRLGMKELPRSVAFFSAVDVDTVLRKEADNECRTPSNIHGLNKGYGIPPGESLDIEEAIKKSNGTLKPFNVRYVSRDQTKARVQGNPWGRTDGTYREPENRKSNFQSWKQSS